MLKSSVLLCKYFKVLFNLLLIICVFDPADLVFRLKMPLFILCLFVFLLDYKNLKINKYPKTIFLINIIFLLIPIISLSFYFIDNLALPENGFNLYKGYLLVILSILLFHFNLNCIKSFSIILNFLSFLIILVYFIVKTFPEYYNIIYLWGLKYQIFLIGERVYDIELEGIWSIYFVTSPLLVIPIAYYTNSYVNNNSFKVLLILFLNIFAMFIAGTRNNMFTSILVPFLIFLYYSKKKNIFIFFSLIGLFAFIYLNIDTITAMFSLNEPSNATKYGLLGDYYNIFNSPRNLLIGQGFGANYFWESRGKFDFVTELTYLEIIRNFGLILGFILLICIFYPIIYAIKNKKNYYIFYLLVAYSFYLFMSANNPIFFMSMGMLFFPIVLSNTFMHFNEDKTHSNLYNFK